MSTTDERPYAGAFREWWLRRSFYAKNFIVLDLIALFVLMVALVASAASSNASSSDTSYSPSYSYDVNSEFLASVHERPALTQNWSDPELVRGAQWVCDQRDLGFSETYVMAEESRLMSDYDAGWFVGAAERVYCPQHYGTSQYGY